MSPLDARFFPLKAEIERLTAVHRRPAGSVRLIAVSKRHEVDKVVELARLGQRDMAENFLQEGLGKIEQAAERLSDLAGVADAGGLSGADAEPLCWHFIGHIQSRKCRLIAENFSWVHSVDSVKVAHKLNQGRVGGEPLNILIQINLHGEEAKSGVSEGQLPLLAEEITGLPNLRLRGLMILPKAEKAFDKQRAVFRRCRELRDALNARGFDLDHLSMGMSGDLEAAIAEGATMVRIGTAVFGPRPAASAPE